MRARQGRIGAQKHSNNVLLCGVVSSRVSLCEIPADICESGDLLLR